MEIPRLPAYVDETLPAMLFAAEKDARGDAAEDSREIRCPEPLDGALALLINMQGAVTLAGKHHETILSAMQDIAGMTTIQLHNVQRYIQEELEDVLVMPEFDRGTWQKILSSATNGQAAA